MDNLQTPRLSSFDRNELMLRAETIRDTIRAKTITAAQVGSLFCHIIDTTADIRTALNDFLSGSVPVITADIDRRLAAVDEVAALGRAELQRSEAARLAVVDALLALSSQNITRPHRVDIIAAPRSITITNPVPQRFRAAVFPSFGFGSVLFISDNAAAKVSPDGVITPLRLGRSEVNAVATADASVYKSLSIDVVPQRCRCAGSALRLDAKGNIRFT